MAMSRLVLLGADVYGKEEICERNGWMDLSTDPSYPAISCVWDIVSQHIWGVPMPYVPKDVTEEQMKFLAVASGAVRNFTGVKVSGIVPASNRSNKVINEALNSANFIIICIDNKFWMKVK